MYLWKASTKLEMLEIDVSVSNQEISMYQKSVSEFLKNKKIVFFVGGLKIITFEK